MSDDESNIHTLSVAPRAATEANEYLVRHLQVLLNKAKKGEVAQAGIVFLQDNGVVGWSDCVETMIGVHGIVFGLGQLTSVLHQRALEHVSSMTASEEDENDDSPDVP